jgi:HEPN domain-containing protein
MAAKPSKPVTTLDPRDMFKHAMRFYLATDRLHAALKQDRLLSDGLVSPMLVLTAFMAEVAMKAQLVSEGTEPKGGHDLIKLFNKLSSPAQKAIEAEWDKLMAANEADTQRLDAQAGEKLPRDLRGALDVSRNSFEELRYLYEGNSNRSYIALLPVALRNALLSLHPDWRHL